MQMLFAHIHVNKHSHCFQHFPFIASAGVSVIVNLDLSTCLTGIPRKAMRQNHQINGNYKLNCRIDHILERKEQRSEDIKQFFLFFIYF